MTSTPHSNVTLFRPSSRQPKILREMQHNRLRGRAPNTADAKVVTILQLPPQPDPALMELYLRCLGFQLVPTVLRLKWFPMAYPPRKTIEAVCL